MARPTRCLTLPRTLKPTFYGTYLDSYTYDDGTVKGYYLYDAAKGDYPVWKVGDIEVADICLMTYYGSSDYSYISFKERYAVIGVYFTDYTDETYDNYNYVYLQWESESEE